MKEKWTESDACKSRSHCRNCLTGNLGKTLKKQYIIPDECPFDVTLDDLPERKDIRINYTDCESCKDKMLEKMTDNQ